MAFFFEADRKLADEIPFRIQQPYRVSVPCEFPRESSQLVGVIVGSRENFFLSRFAQIIQAALAEVGCSFEFRQSSNVVQESPNLLRKTSVLAFGA
jgi:hypothetical protein